MKILKNENFRNEKKKKKKACLTLIQYNMIK